MGSRGLPLAEVPQKHVDDASRASGALRWKVAAMRNPLHLTSLLWVLLSAWTASAADVASLSINPSSVPSGYPALGTVTLTGPAPSGGQWVSLSSDSSSVMVLPQVLVPEGTTSAMFSLVTGSVTTDTTAFLTAATGATARSASLTVNAPVPVDAITLTPSTISSGAQTELTVTLQRPASPGGTAVQLTSSQPSLLALPLRLFIPGGSQSFSLMSAPITGNTTVTVTASAANVSRSATLTVTGASSLGAIELLSGCEAVTLPPNDDGSSAPVPLPFPVNFFGTAYTYLYVNNNGNVTFRAPLGTFTPFEINATTPPIIAPFLADVDTRGSGSSPVRYSYGMTHLGGRPAFCANWVNVGYFSGHTDKLNSFQLLLVDRSDVAPGDFDILMNYGRVLWETGDASGGQGGLGGVSAGAGFSAGNGNPNAFFQLPGSLVNGALLDSNVLTGLSRTSRNSLVPGRHVFEVRNGQSTGQGVLAGDVSDGSQPLVGAPVQVCPAGGGACAYATLTNPLGRYQATGLRPGAYVVTVFPPAGSNANPRTVGPVTFTGAETLEQDVTLQLPVPPPPNITLAPSSVGSNGIPSLNARQAVDLRMEGCPGGSATWSVMSSAGLAASGTMTEGPAMTYSARIPPLAPAIGPASISVRLVCPDSTEHLYGFDVSLYIDPSGTVRTPSGAAVAGATVVLYRSDRPYGPFLQVPHGSAIMSPDNRDNADTTDAEGQFRWDVIAGYYRVRASKAGCVSVTGAPYVESPVMTIPPPVTDLDLRLVCDTLAPTSQATLSVPPNAQGWHRGPVTVTLSASDEGGGVKELSWSTEGAQVGSARVAGSLATVRVAAEGETRLRWTARDEAGNQEAVHTLTLRIDSTPPRVHCAARPEVLWPANHQHRLVEIDVQVEDALSGAAGFILGSVSSSEPADARGDGHTSEDMKEWKLGTEDTLGLLRAERSSPGQGRTYTLGYEARDQAGNTAACQARVLVPHDLRR